MCSCIEDMITKQARSALLRVLVASYETVSERPTSAAWAKVGQRSRTVLLGGRAGKDS